MHSSSERTGTDFSAVKHQSHQPSSSIFHQKQEVNSSDFFNRPLHRRNFYSQSHPCGPGICVGNKGSGWPGNWLSVQPAEKKNRLQTGQEFHLQSALVQASLLLKHQPTGQLKRTRPLMSYPVSQSRVLPTNHEAGHVFSPTRKVGSAFFRTHVYCDYSPCFANPAWLSVVGFCGL